MRALFRGITTGTVTRYGIAMLTFLALVAVPLCLLAPSPAKAIHMFTPTQDVSSQMSIDVMVAYDSLHARSGDTVSFLVKVTECGLPVNRSYVNFTADYPGACAFEYENGGFTDADGLISVNMTVHSEQLVIVNITAKAYYGDYMPGYYEIRYFSIEPRPVINDNVDEKKPSNTVSIGVGSIGLGGVIALAIIGSTEVGRYALMSLFVVPLYSRLKKDEMLDHFVRGQIYGYIMSHPGEHYNHIKHKLDVTNGTLSHHLRALELQGYIKSQRDGTYKRFYPTDVKIPRTKGIKLSDLQLGILDTVRQSPGISQKEIAAREGISQQSVSYNLSVLERMGVLDASREGIRKKYFISSDT